MDWREYITFEPDKRADSRASAGCESRCMTCWSTWPGGMTADEVLDDFPYLTADDIRACCAFAAEPVRRIRDASGQEV